MPLKLHLHQDTSKFICFFVNLLLLVVTFIIILYSFYTNWCADVWLQKTTTHTVHFGHVWMSPRLAAYWQKKHGLSIKIYWGTTVQHFNQGPCLMNCADSILQTVDDLQPHNYSHKLFSKAFLEHWVLTTWQIDDTRKSAESIRAEFVLQEVS